jgi:hypothetical protein
MKSFIISELNLVYILIILVIDNSDEREWKIWEKVGLF